MLSVISSVLHLQRTLTLDVDQIGYKTHPFNIKKCLAVLIMCVQLTYKLYMLGTFQSFRPLCFSLKDC